MIFKVELRNTLILTSAKNLDLNYDVTYFFNSTRSTSEFIIEQNSSETKPSALRGLGSRRGIDPRFEFSADENGCLS